MDVFFFCRVRGLSCYSFVWYNGIIVFIIVDLKGFWLVSKREKLGWFYLLKF